MSKAKSRDCGLPPKRRSNRQMSWATTKRRSERRRASFQAKNALSGVPAGKALAESGEGIAQGVREGTSHHRLPRRKARPSLPGAVLPLRLTGITDESPVLGQSRETLARLRQALSSNRDAFLPRLLCRPALERLLRCGRRPILIPCGAPRRRDRSGEKAFYEARRGSLSAPFIGGRPLLRAP